MLAMDVWCFSKSTARIDLEKHQTRLHYWGISLCNFGESPLQFWVFLLYTKHLWYENYILDDNDELTGIIDFENAKYGDPASDISALCYLGNEFINLFLKYYKNSDKDIEKRINMFIKAREVMSFENMVNNFPEEINEQIEKIKKVL